MDLQTIILKLLSRAKLKFKKADRICEAFNQHEICKCFHLDHLNKVLLKLDGSQSQELKLMV